MEYKVSIAITSHLSDIQIEMTIPDKQQHVHTKLNFVKRLVMKLDSGVKFMNENELDELWADTLEKYP